MLKASIDIGSNSLLLLAGNVENNVLKRELLNKCEIAGLGKDIDKTYRLSSKSMATAFDILEKYKQLLANINIRPQEVIVTATEASRVAKNSASFFKKIEENLGLRPIIINGEGEAYYTAKGLVLARPHEAIFKNEIIVMDLGGASTEIIKLTINPFEIKLSKSLKIGSVRSFDLISKGEFTPLCQKLLTPQELIDFQGDELICVAGTMVALGGLLSLPPLAPNLSQYDEPSLQKLEKFSFSYAQFAALTKKLKSMSPDEIKGQYPFLKKRALTLSSGAQLALNIFKNLAVKKIIISTYGLRYGTLISGGIDEQFIVTK